MSLYRNLITMLSASVLRSKPFDDVSDKNVQGSLESLNFKINTVAAQNVRLTTLGLPAASGSVLGDFIRLKDTAGVRSLDRGVSSTGAWIQSRSSSDYTVNYTLLLNPNGGTVASGGPVTVTGASASVSVGTNPSQSGAFRLANTQTIRWRNAANSADGFSIAQSAADALVIYDPSNNPLFTINAAGLTLPGPLTVGGFEVGTKILPQSTKSVDYTLVLTDSGKHILHPTADTSTRTFTIPSNASVAFPAGTTVTFINQISAGNVYVDIVADTMVLAGVGQTSSVLLAPNSIATALKVTTTQWLITLIDSQSLTLAQQQDLSGKTAIAVHRSPNAIVGMFWIDTGKDSDNGDWIERCSHTSWQRSALSSKWLGWVANEAAARAIGGATTGDYYGSTADGRHYKLSGGSGVTAVLVGNKAKFPRLGLVIVEAGYVAIYDMTEPTFPMWRSWVAGTNFFVGTNSSGAIQSVTYGEGKLLVSTSTRSISLMDFPADTGLSGSGAGVLKLSPNYGLADTQTGAVHPAMMGTAPAFTLGHINVYSVAIHVANDAPASVVTGLKVPTLAFGGGASLQVLRNDGVLVTGIAFQTINVSFDQYGSVLSLGENARNIRRAMAPLYTTYQTYGGGPMNIGVLATMIYDNKSKQHGSKLATIRQTTPDVALWMHGGTSGSNKNIAARISNDRNTGWMYGDNRRTLLCGVPVGAISDVERAPALEPANWTVTGSDGTHVITWLGGAFRYQADTMSPALMLTAVVLTVGEWYEVSVTTSSYTSGSVKFTSFDSTDTNINTGVGTHTFRKQATTSSLQLLRVGTNVDLTISGISVKVVTPDRSYKNQPIKVYGTLTSAPIAVGAQMTAVSGFSAVNYLQQPYSADLDPGTGEWTLSSVAATTNAPASNLFTQSEFANGVGDAQAKLGLITAVPSMAGSIGTTTGLAFGWDGTTWTSAYKTTVSTQVKRQTTLSITVVMDDGLAPVFGSAAGTDASNDFGIVIGSDVIPPTTYIVTPLGSNRYRVSATAAPFLSTTSNGVVKYASNSSRTFKTTDWQIEFTSLASSYKPTTTTPAIGLGIIASRRAASGAYYTLGMNGYGQYVAVVHDGTTTRTVTSTTSYNNGAVHEVRVNYTVDGSLAMLVRGTQVAITTGTPLLTLNNATAVLTVGQSYALDAPFPGTLANIKFGLSVPSAEQSLCMYEQERLMRLPGAQCLLPVAQTVSAMDYDTTTDEWVSTQASFVSRWKTLVRVSSIAPPAGSFSQSMVTRGMTATSITATSPGVYVWTPAISLRNEVLKTGTIPDKKLPLKPFEYDAVASQVDFPIPAGFVPIRVAVAGVIKREGSTKDYTLIHDGFIWTVRFAVAPGAAAWVQITPVLE